MQKVKLIPMAAVLLSTMTSLSAVAQGGSSAGSWVSAWSTAVHTPLPFPGLPPTPVLENQTVRMVVRPSIGGQQLRIRFSNAYGTTALEVGAAHVAVAGQKAAIEPGTDRAITFNGKTSVTIPPGAPILSDPIEMKVPAFTELAISIYLPHSSTASSTHFWAQHDSYLSGPGDFTAKADIPGATVRPSWYWLADVAVWNSENVAAVVALGDSITDGVGAKQGTYNDWPDLLAKRLAEAGTTLAVLNEGIGGNRILRDGAGDNALARLDRDVLAQPGVRELILLEGINDIGWPNMKMPPPKGGSAPRKSPFAGQFVTAQDLIEGYRQIIDRARQHHIKVFGATITPYEGADYYTADGETIRQTVNQWMRTSGAFDGVFDFDVAVRDPEHPSKFRESLQSGDHLHPSELGYQAMAKAVDVTALKGFLP